MKNLLKQGIAGIMLAAAVVFSLIGGIIYTISGTQGYLYGTPFNSLPLVFALISVVIIAVVILAGNKFPKLVPYLNIAASAFLVLALCLFALERVSVVQEILIPNEHSAELYSAFNLSVAGGVLLLLAIIGVAVANFRGIPAADGKK